MFIVFSTTLNPIYALNISSNNCNETFDKALYFYNIRAKDAKDWRASKQYIDSAILHLRKTVNCKSTEQKSVYYLLKSLHFKAMYTDISEETKKQLYNEAKNLGEEYIQIYPNDVGIKVWYLANAGKWIQYYGILRAAYEGIGPRIKATCEDIVRLDSLYENGIGFRILGLVYYQAPYIPVLLTWADKEKGIELTRKSLKINPDNIGNLLFMGKILFMDEQYESAKTYLIKCTEKTAREDYLIMERFDQMKARFYLNEIAKKNE